MWYMNEERELLQGAFREFAQTRVRPHVAKMEEEDADCRDLVLEMGQLGFLGFNLPEEVGGAGIDYINYALMLEEIAKESYTVAFSAMLGPMFNRAFTVGATEEQIKKYVPAAINGEILIALTGNEPTGGNWMDGYQTVAVRDGDEWVVNGTKVLISQSDVADYFMVMARTKDHVDPMTMDGLEMFIINTDAQGITNGHIENKVGLNGSRTGTVYFNDVRIPDANRFKTANVFTIEEFCGCYGAMDLGAAEACLDKAIAYLKQREQFGVSLWDAHESARVDAAKLHGKISNFRNALYGHMANLTNGERNMLEAIPIKEAGAKLLEEVARECMILMGGAGVIYETGIERSYRDAVVSAMACGSEKTLQSLAGMFL